MDHTQLINNDIRSEVVEYNKRLKLCVELLKDSEIMPIIPDGSWYLSINVSNYFNSNIRSSLMLAEKILKDCQNEILKDDKTENQNR